MTVARNLTGIISQAFGTRIDHFDASTLALLAQQENWSTPYLEAVCRQQIQRIDQRLDPDFNDRAEYNIVPQGPVM